MEIGQVENVELLGIAGPEVGIARRAEGNPFAIGRPGKRSDTECVALGERLRLGQFLGIGWELGGQFDQPEVIHGVIAADDFEVAVLFLAVFACLGVGPGGGEGDGRAVGRPGDGADAVLLGSQLRGFAAGGRDQVDLALAIAVARESEAARIGRPLRAAGDFLAAGELVALAGGGHGDPDLRVEIVLVPVGLLHGVGDVAAVGRDLRAGHGLHAERFLDGGGLRGGGERYEKAENQAAHAARL